MFIFYFVLSSIFFKIGKCLVKIEKELTWQCMPVVLRRGRSKRSSLDHPILQNKFKNNLSTRDPISKQFSLSRKRQLGMVTNLKITASGKQKQKDGKFKAILRHRVRLLSTKHLKKPYTYLLLKVILNQAKHAFKHALNNKLNI